jgi:DNA-binding CsgD family transcriptional regulator
MLTKQENKIAELISLGYSEKEIASKLFIADSTVHTHSRNIRRKLKARNSVDVARYFIVKYPYKFLVGLVFLVIQLFAVFTVQDLEMRNP